MEDDTKPNLPSYILEAPGASEFSILRNSWREEMAGNLDIRKSAIDLIKDLQEYKFGYQWEWCGIPVIRYPEDLMLQHEIMWNFPICSVIETGIARGGSVAFSSSMLRMKQNFGQVLGIDIKIHDHAHSALLNYTNEGSIQFAECNSTSLESQSTVSDFIDRNPGPTLVILDSDHSHDHVLAELRMFSKIIPKNSIIMVADTVVEELPNESFPNRRWDKGSNPLTAVREFLIENKKFRPLKDYCRRGVVSEFRDGIIFKERD